MKKETIISHKFYMRRNFPDKLLNEKPITEAQRKKSRKRFRQKVIQYVRIISAMEVSNGIQRNRNKA